VADSGECCAELGGTSLLRQIKALDDVETGGADVGVADCIRGQSGERRVGLDRLADLLPDGVFANAEQDMLAVTNVAVVLREEILQVSIGFEY
jgi:hypothetical protein